MFFITQRIQFSLQFYCAERFEPFSASLTKSCSELKVEDRDFDTETRDSLEALPSSRYGIALASVIFFVLQTVTGSPTTNNFRYHDIMGPDSILHLLLKKNSAEHTVKVQNKLCHLTKYIEEC